MKKGKIMKNRLLLPIGYLTLITAFSASFGMTQTGKEVETIISNFNQAIANENITDAQSILDSFKGNQRFRNFQVFVPNMQKLVAELMIGQKFKTLSTPKTTALENFFTLLASNKLFVDGTQYANSIKSSTDNKFYLVLNPNYKLVTSAGESQKRFAINNTTQYAIYKKELIDANPTNPLKIQPIDETDPNLYFSIWVDKSKKNAYLYMLNVDKPAVNLMTKYLNGDYESITTKITGLKKVTTPTGTVTTGEPDPIVMGSLFE